MRAGWSHFRIMQRHMVLLVAVTLCTSALSGQSPDGISASRVPMFITANASGPAGGEVRYIVALEPGARSNQVVPGGGRIEKEAPGYVEVTVPEEAIEGIRRNPNVRYIQRVIPPEEALEVERRAREGMGKSAAGASPQSAESTGAAAPPPLAPNSTTLWSSGTYSYDGSGNIRGIGQSTYRYDALGRLVRSSTVSNGAAYPETYLYDQFGNMTQRTTGTVQKDMPVDPATNRLNAPVTYDVAGSLTADGMHTYVHDAFGQISQIDGATGKFWSVYNADGERVGSYDQSTGNWRWTPRDLSGKVSRDYLATGGTFDFPVNYLYVWKEDYAYRDGHLIGAVREQADGGRRHFHLDHLGTPRVTTSESGAVIARNDYYPFGQEITSMRQQVAAGADREEPMRFTGHERDFIGRTYAENVDYIDYMHARFYSPILGRFLSVDPHLDDQKNMSTPQRWNRYGYVTNNPLLYVDPDGRDLQPADYVEAVWDATKQTADDVGFLIAKPALTLMAGFINDDPALIAKGSGMILLDGGIGAVGSIGASRLTMGFTSRGNLLNHFTRHGKEMGFKMPETYGAAARKFVGTAGKEGVQTVAGKGGVQYVYSATTKEFAVVNANGGIVTYFKASHKYWARQLKKLDEQSIKGVMKTN